MHSNDYERAEACKEPHLRLAAGQDPAKRAQILAGAGRVISRMGYDAASVNDIAREAGVSKGTIYVYFSGKEDLFEELMEETRERLFQELEAELDRPGDISERLVRYGEVVTRKLCSDPVIRAHRVMIGVTERMPELGIRFYDRGGRRGTILLMTYLEAEVAAGRLVIEDVQLAASQFFELCMAGLFRRRLFGHMAAEPTEDEIARTIHAAVEMFLCRYGKAGGAIG
ncbi:MAG: TetR/AcrR family transcriptional regulator [Paracoccaceae bacterium]|nr:TetR/AcrR family transcriptional regulator [Paracoccaceae bacterium]MDE3239372.1 TetR/AcrR family transcriptional regulator [Paracoccaceae bacterium]